MSRTRARLSRLLAWLALVLLALRTPAPLRAAAELATAPAGILAELASPVAWLRRARVRAAERRLADRAPAEAEESVRVVSQLSARARPSDPSLLAGRRLVHGEVVGPSRASRDLLRVRVADLRGLVPGLPVACGDAYVGRVHEVPVAAGSGLPAPLPGELLVELVTARGFHVGARVAPSEAGEAGEAGAERGAEVLMTVGGLDDAGHRRRGSFELRLAVHHPSDRELDAGLARVHELFATAEPFASLSEGLRLGPVRRPDPDGRAWIEPELDYEDGLFHLVVLAPPAPGLPAEATREPSLLDTNWLEAPTLSVGDPSSWRETAKIRAGTRDGVAPGAAVTAIGARLVGRVARVGPFTADVSFVGDPGFGVVVVALFEGLDGPRVLGRLVSLGRAQEGGAVRMAWKARVPLELEPTAPDGTRRARLFTGSGDAGLESGFYLGEARVPVRREPDGGVPLVLLEADLDPRDAGTLFVRLEPDDVRSLP